MPKFSYTSGKNKDVFYITKSKITDPFFLLEIGNRHLVFLNNLEIGAFKEKLKENNIDGKDQVGFQAGQNIEVVPVDGLYKEAELIEGTDRLSHKLALHIIQKYKINNEPIEVPSYFPLDMADFLRSKGIILTVKNPFRPERAIKNKDEVDKIRDSIKKTEKAYKKIEEILHDSKINGDTLFYRDNILTSEIIRREVDKIFLEEDLFSIEGSIISCGAHSAMPHHQGFGPIRPNQTIICDLFPVSKTTGYFADMTRTYVKGKSSEKMQKMYDAVLKAQKLGLSMVKPGIKASDIHEAVAGSLIDSGFDAAGNTENAGFIHSTGHGLGLDIHESPSVSKNSDTILSPGHVITIEPGLYYPDIGGVRIEDVVYVTENGSENLTNYPKEFVIK